MSDTLERIPPQDLEAEQACLGSMLLAREAIGEVLMVIPRDRAECFYRPDHRTIFDVLCGMYDAGQTIDLITARDTLTQRGQLDQIGGVDYLVTLAESVPSAVNAEHYARIVASKASLREIIRVAGEIQDAAYTQSEDPRELIDQCEARLLSVCERQVSEGSLDIRSQLDEVFAALERNEGGAAMGLPTGFTELDAMLCGLQPGELIVIGARPSMGKTALGICIADYLAVSRGLCVAFFSMEMSKQAIAHRLLCARGRVDSQHLRRGFLNQTEIEALRQARDALSDSRLFIDDKAGMHILELRAKARRLHARHHLDAVFVDYLQLLRSPSRDRNREQEVAEVSRGLKALAKELNVPVVVMAQLNRGNESRSDNRPRMSDLRESGSIEQDCDVIMLLHREEYYKREATPPELQGVAEVIIDKNRNGPTGTVRLYWNRQYTRFDNLAAGALPSAVQPPPSDYEPALYDHEPEAVAIEPSPF